MTNQQLKTLIRNNKKNKLLFKTAMKLYKLDGTEFTHNTYLANIMIFEISKGLDAMTKVQLINLANANR